MYVLSARLPIRLRTDETVMTVRVFLWKNLLYCLTYSKQRRRRHFAMLLTCFDEHVSLAGMGELRRQTRSVAERALEAGWLSYPCSYELCKAINQILWL